MQLRMPRPLAAGNPHLMRSASVPQGHSCGTDVSTNSFIGRGSRIRTCGPLLPKQVLYQAELCPDNVGFQWVNLS